MYREIRQRVWANIVIVFACALSLLSLGFYLYSTRYSVVDTHLTVTLETKYTHSFDIHNVTNLVPQNARIYKHNSKLHPEFTVHVLRGRRALLTHVENPVFGKEYTVFALSDYAHRIHFEFPKKISSVLWGGQHRATHLRLRDGAGSFVVFKMWHRDEMTILSSKGIEFCNQKQCR